MERDGPQQFSTAFNDDYNKDDKYCRPLYSLATLEGGLLTVHTANRTDPFHID